MPLYLYQAQEVQRLKKQLCAHIGDLRYFTPNKNRLTHDRPRKGQKIAYKSCTKTEKRVNEWITN